MTTALRPGTRVLIHDTLYGSLDGLTGVITPKPACIPDDINAGAWVALDLYADDGYNHTPVGVEAGEVTRLYGPETEEHSS